MSQIIADCMEVCKIVTQSKTPTSGWGHVQVWLIRVKLVGVLKFRHEITFPASTAQPVIAKQDLDKGELVETRTSDRHRLTATTTWVGTKVRVGSRSVSIFQPASQNSTPPVIPIYQCLSDPWFRLDPQVRPNI